MCSVIISGARDSSLKGLLNIELVLRCIAWQAQAISFENRCACTRTDDADTAAMVKSLEHWNSLRLLGTCGVSSSDTRRSTQRKIKGCKRDR